MIACSFVFATSAVKFSSHAQESENRQITVEAEELPSAYGAPPDLSHGRISTLTKSYVLSPYSFDLSPLLDTIENSIQPDTWERLGGSSTICVSIVRSRCPGGELWQGKRAGKRSDQGDVTFDDMLF